MGSAKKPMAMLMSHCSIVSPQFLQTWNPSPAKVMMMACSPKMDKTMMMNNLLVSIPAKMLRSSWILRQPTKLKTCIITKVLKMKVKCLEQMPVQSKTDRQSSPPVMVISLPLRIVPPTTPLCHFHSGRPLKTVVSYESLPSGMNLSPAKTSTTMMMNWKTACPRMCFIIVFEMMFSWRLFGGLSSNSSVGDSVARASEARVSMIRLIHNIWMGARICCLQKPLPTRVMVTATIFTVIWNWMNLRMESQMFLPHSTAFTMELKLSSSRMMAAAQRATQVPAIPIANPTSAFFRAGASLVPSPVTATTYPRSLRPVTKAYLSSGRERASTQSLSLMRSKAAAFQMVSTLSSLSSASASFEFLAQSQVAVLHFLQTTPPIILMKSAPSITRLSSPSLIMPTSLAMALAVMILSPVTILTLMPALWHLAIASGTSFLGMSRTPKRQTKMRLFFYTLKTPFWSLVWRSSEVEILRQARQRVLRDDSAIFLMVSSIFPLRAQVMGSTLLVFISYHQLQHPSTISDAPLTNRQFSESLVSSTDILLRAELKGYFRMVGYISRYVLQLTPSLLMNFRRAISVEDPFYSGCRRAVLSTQAPIFSNSAHSWLLVISWMFSASLWESISMVEPFHTWVSVILFIVKVPVLSEQMLLAPPIVSQASNFRTRLLSLSICLTDTASESVTERGSPSGMATTMTVIASMKQLMSSLRSLEVSQVLSMLFSIPKRTSRTTRMSMAEQRPNFPIVVANFYSFACRGVMLSSY